MNRLVYHDCVQSGDNWLRLRLGKPTASGFDRIVTPTGKIVTGKGRTTYLHELAAEAITQTVHQEYLSDAMLAGQEREMAARAWYSWTRDVEVRRVGFVEDADGRWGCSPDGLVLEDGGIEVKCPQRTQYVAALLADNQAQDYMPQIQGCLWVTGRAWWDFVLYTTEPGLPKIVRRIEPDPKWQAAFDDAIPAFCDELAAMVKRIREIRS